MKKSTSFSIETANLTEMQKLASERQLSVSDIANEAIRVYLKARERNSEDDRKYLLGEAPWLKGKAAK